MKHREQLAVKYPEIYVNLVNKELKFDELQYLNNIIAMNADHALVALCRDVLKEEIERKNVTVKHS